MEIRALSESDDRSGFRSGDAELDRFLPAYAAQNQFRHHIGTTYVALERGTIVGFATVAPGHLEIDRLTTRVRRKLPRYPLPILRLARLAVDEAAQGQGVGSTLLRFVFSLALRLAEKYGCIGVVVDAKPAAAAFYESLGFRAVEVLEGGSSARPAPVTMFLPLSEVEAALR